MSGINVNLRGLTTTETDARYYQQGQFIDASAGVADAGKPIKTDASGLIDSSFLPAVPAGDIDIYPMDGRLTTSSTNPANINVYTSYSPTLYYLPYTGNKISLIVSGVNTVKTIPDNTPLSIDVSALDTYKRYDVFAYWDSGTSSVKLETVKYTAPILTRYSPDGLNNYGCRYKTGDVTRKYIGSFFTWSFSGTKTRDFETHRLVSNEFNKIQKFVVTYNTTASWTYAILNTWRACNAGTGQVEGHFLVVDELTQLDCVLSGGKVAMDVASKVVKLGVGVGAYGGSLTQRGSYAEFLSTASYTCSWGQQGGGNFINISSSSAICSKIGLMERVEIGGTATIYGTEQFNAQLTNHFV